MQEELQMIAMEIILHAGNARTFIMESYELMGEEQFEASRQKLKDAKQEIVLAHKAQTEVIQGEARGEEHDFSLLFAHAQDTLMTVMSESNIANKLVGVFEKMSQKINQK
jgi:cellobiose-specific phosphotransferase system component IIA